MYTPPPPPPQAVHRPAPEVNIPKNAENYRTQPENTSTSQAAAPVRRSRSRINRRPSRNIFFITTHRASKHTNRLHSRKQAKARAKRKARR